MSAGDLVRCAWSGTEHHMIEYHDTVWGVPVHDDRRLFEFLILEGAQAGLSWATILGRFDTYLIAYENFDAETIAAYGDDDVARLLNDPGIIRNRAKVAASIKNAKATLEVRREFGSLDAYLWGFVDGAPTVNAYRTMDEVPAETEASKAMSKALKNRGFGFVGPTICYALMQAVGMVNDHTVDCFRYEQLR